MAKGKKTGGRDFQPGHTFGKGRPAVPDDLKKSRSLNRIEFERTLNKYVQLTAHEINLAMKSTSAPILEMIVAKILAKAFNEGDTRRLEFILERLIGRPVEHPEGEFQNDNSHIKQKSFEDFCVDAGYPRPYSKQVEMMLFAFVEEVTRILLGARKYGKTDYVTVLGTAYDIYKNPVDSTNLIISKSKSRNSAMINEIASALKANGVYLEVENSSIIRVEGLVGTNHSVEALTIKSSFRGRHPKRIIMDDPVTEEDVSDATRVLVKRKYDEAIKLCKNVCVIGQPASPFDLFAELRPILKKMEVPHGQIPELDDDLEAMRLAGVDADSISMSYHLKIPATGNSIFCNLKFIDKLPAGPTIAFIDPSDGGDYTAITIFRGMGGSIAVEGHVWKKAWYLCLDDMVPILKARSVNRVGFETNKHGEQPIDQLRELFKKLNLPIGVSGSYSDTNKHQMIKQAGSFSHLIHLSKESSATYTDQVVRYEYKAKFDDGPDSLARGMKWIGFIRGKK